MASSGIVAVSSQITTGLLKSAYYQGIFPWFNESEGESVLWWSPDPRFVILPDELHVPTRLARSLDKLPFTYTVDTCFERVVAECAAAKRVGQNGTWIGRKIFNAYCSFFDAGYAHSVEVWQADKLVGGFYGVLIGSVFCGESMFTKESNSAKSAFVRFAHAFFECGGGLIDSQVYTDNMARYGGKNISRSAFLRLERELLFKPLKADVWSKINY